MKRRIFVLIAVTSIGCGDAMDEADHGTAVIDLETGASISAYRDPNRDWREYEQERMKKHAASARASALTALTVDQSKVSTTQANFSNVPYWTDAEIKTAFRALRDERFLAMSTDPGYPRRMSWMYPEDGCWTRAEVFAQAAWNRGLARPHRLFSFGNLVVHNSPNEDPNDSNWTVNWNYHVVPLVRSASSGMPYALDPAIEPTRPLPWQEWLLRQVPALSQVLVVVGDAGAYHPGSPVTGGPTNYTNARDGQQNTWLGLEWTRQADLMRDLNLVLGDYPPWRNDRFYVASSTPAPLTIIPTCTTCTGADALSARCNADCW